MKTILVVDDQSDIRRLLRIALMRDFNIVEAEDAEQALAVIESSPPDLILLDVMMPGYMDGLDVLKKIKADPALSHIPVAMVTARGQLADTQDATLLGADGYFVKPFSPIQVSAWVRERLG